MKITLINGKIIAYTVGKKVYVEKRYFKRVRAALIEDYKYFVII